MAPHTTNQIQVKSGMSDPVMSTASGPPLCTATTVQVLYLGQLWGYYGQLIYNESLEPSSHDGSAGCQQNLFLEISHVNQITLAQADLSDFRGEEK